MTRKVLLLAGVFILAALWHGPLPGLLFTSIHMTLLGALFALAPGTIYRAHLAAHPASRTCARAGRL